MFRSSGHHGVTVWYENLWEPFGCTSTDDAESGTASQAADPPETFSFKLKYIFRAPPHTNPLEPRVGAVAIRGSTSALLATHKLRIMDRLASLDQNECGMRIQLNTAGRLQQVRGSRVLQKKRRLLPDRSKGANAAHTQRKT